jgi:hypothetical protein
MWGIGASLDVEDEGGGEIPVSCFKDCVSILGVANDFVCKAEEGLLVFGWSGGDFGWSGGDFGWSGGDGGFVYEVGEETIGDCEGGDCEEGDFSSMSGGVNASSLESDIESGDFEREGCKPPSPLARADNRSPSPSDVLRYRAVGLSTSAVSGGAFGGSEARGGMADFSPTSCPISTSGFVG